MTIIQTLIKQNSLQEQNLSLFNQILKLEELTLFLDNLDKLAKLYQKSTFSKDAEFQLKQEKAEIKNNLTIKILKIMDNENIDLNKLIKNAEKISDYLGNDIDMTELKPAQRRTAHKLCIICNIILDTYTNTKLEKTL